MWKLFNEGHRFCFNEEGGGDGGGSGGGGSSSGSEGAGDAGDAGEQGGGSGEGGQGGQGAGAEPPEFAVPDAYKEQGWAKNIKSGDDLWKQLENSQKLIGQKTVAPLDYKTATPEQIAEHHKSLAPADRSAYEFHDPNDPLAVAVGDAFIGAGINEHQGKAVVDALAPILEKMEAEINAANTTQEGYEKLSKEAFGDKYQEVTGKVEALLKANAPDDATKKALDDMPNDFRIAVDKVVSKVSEGYEARIAAILKEHGITESGAQGEGSQGGAAKSKAETQAQLRKEIRELSAKPHTAEQKQALLDKLNATYQ